MSTDVRAPRRLRMRSLVATIMAFTLVVVGLTLANPEPAEAVVVQWGRDGGTAPNYQANVNGDFLMAGNGVLACTATTGTANGTCSELHSTSSNTENVNDNFIMSNVNAVSGFTTNSSSATVNVPAGATVVKAFLTWSANTGVYTGDSRYLCTPYSTSRGTATMPAGSTTGYTSRAVQLRVGSGAIANVAPQSVLVDPTSQATARYYSASADVTAAFSGVATGSNVTISAGNIWTPTGAGCYAGWSVTVVYDYGAYIADNPASAPHNVIFYEGHVRQGANDSPLTVAFNGFTAVAPGTRAGFTLFEGDRSITGDTASYARGTSTTYAVIPNADGITNNIGIGRATNSVRYTGSGTPFTNQSVDVTVASLYNVSAGDSRVNLRLATTGDSYLLRNAVLSVPTAGLQVSKSFDGTADTQSRVAGEAATFTIRVTNTGAGSLRNIVVEDDQADCSRALTGVTLAPSESTTFTCTGAAPTTEGYVSTAEATAYTSLGNYLAQDSDTTTVRLSAITLEKTSALAPGATGRAGDVLTYTFTVRNTGESTLSGIVIRDPLPGLSAIVFGSWPGQSGVLQPGQSVTATATYTLTQSDVDAGSIANSAVVTASDEDGGLQPSGNANRVTPIAAAGAIGVSKTGTLASGATGRVGDRIDYVFTFTNTGNVTLDNASLVDPLPGLSPPVVTWPTATAGRLPVGATARATASYTITQADVDAGFVRNTATATGRIPTGATVSGRSPQVQVATIASAPGLTTTKSGSITSGTGGVGSTITYTFTLRNSGNTTLTAVGVADPLPGLSALSYTWPGTAGRLAPGQSVTATATYTITQADVDAGAVRNTATGTATTPAGAVLSVPSSQSTVVTAPSAPAITLTKTGALRPGSTGSAGDVVDYTFTIRNSGNVTLSGAAIADPLPGLTALAYTWPGAAGVLAPGQTATATASYTLTQRDVDAGSAVNSATVTARPPAGVAVTQTRSATVPISPSGTLTVLKSGALTAGDGSVGSTVTYRFSVTNTGNVTLSQVAIADALPGLSAIAYTWPGTARTLAPGQTAQGTATYTIRQADVDAGAVTNTATASGRTPAGATVTGASTAVRVATIAAAPATTTTKAASVSGTGSVGDVITYTVRTTNSGNVTLDAVRVTDALPGLSAFTYTWPGAAGRLAPGQSVTAVASYTITQADVDAGAVRNTASSTATFGATTVTSTSGPVVTETAAAAPALVTTKSGALQSGSSGRAGDTITWSITLRNAGNVTLTAVSVADPLPGITLPSYGTWPDGTAGVLRPGQTVTATATSVITQFDVDSGAVANTATGTGQPPAGGAVSSVAPATVSLASAPGLTLAKTGAVSAGNGGVGSTVTYSFTARNTGNVTLTGVAIQDPHAGLSAIAYAWPGAAGTLSPGQTLTATATYRISQADVDAGVVRNTATISGRPLTGPAITATAQANVPTIAAAPAITTSKTAAGAGARVGETVTYTFRASNSGNVTLTDVAITDPLPQLGALEYSWPGTPGTLAPGQTVTATAGYTVTQADVDAGSITNTSTATGSAGGATVTARSGAVITPTAASAPALVVSKTGTLDGAGVSGDTISYAFTVRNAGNVTLTGVSLADPLIGAAPIALSGWAGAPGTLAPGESVSGVATYTLTQGDVDAGAVANIATASGTPLRGASVTGTAPATVPIAPSPQISVSKTGAVTSGDGTAGSVITFSFAIRNAGNVTLSAVSLTDSLAGLSAPTISWPGAANVLAPGQSATGTATYTVRQSDVDAGEVRNTASASGRPPTGPVVSATSGTAVVPTAAAAPALTVTKSASPAGGRVGEVISYSIRVQNSGNQTLTAVSIADQLPGLSTLAVTWPGTPRTLAPGQTATARATYTITQSDVNTGAVQNRASASGTAPGGVPVNAQSPLVTTPTVTAAAGISFTKTASLAPGATGRAGDAVTYTFTIGNSGNVTLTGVTVDDRMLDLSVPSYVWPGAAGVLLPGQSAIATATRTLTQADVDAGAVANTATATGTPPSGPAVERTASATLPLAPGPALTITKSGAYTSGTGAVGSVIGYTFTARNTGNVTLTAVAVTDGLAGLSPIALTWPGTPGTLAPGAAVTGTATYTVTQADVDAGRITNSARVSGTPPSGPAVGATSSPVVLATAAAGPALTTTKTATVSGIRGVGDVVTYTLSATNSGNVTLRAVSISDPLPGLAPLVYAWPGDAGVLAPGERVTATTSHTITQADVDAGSLVNTATSTGTAPNGPVVSAASPTVTTPTVAASPQLQVGKSGALPDGAKGVADEVITWTVTLRNTGNVTLTGVTARDSLPGISDLVYGPWPGGSEGTLAPGASVTATATSIVRQSDVDAGAVSNTATATGAPSRGQPATGIGSATVTLAADPGLSIGKSGAYTTGTGAVGDEITYSYAVQNTGNVTLTGVTINDPHSGLSTISYGAWPTTAGTLAPGQTVSATATYVVRQSDVNTGSITDTATVSGRTPTGAAVAATSPTVVLPTSAAAPALLTTKTATVGGSGAVGDLVTYTLRAANTGNVTLTGVRITDPAPGLSPIIYGSWPSAVGTLQPGQSVSATTTHRITQADLDVGSIRNTATSTGTPPSGPAVSDPSDEVTVATAAQRPDIAVTKSGVLAPGATGAVGDTVNFSFTLRNSGNVTLTGVALDERLAGVSDPVYSWPATAGTLAPGQTVTATATYGLTQADIDAGSVVNTVVGGASFGGASITKDASATVPLSELVSPAVSVSTDGVLSGDPKAGSTVTWTYTLTNTGNVTLTAAGVSDALPGVTAPQYGPWPAIPGTLAPGESVTATATSVLTQAEVDAGAIVSVVTGTGTSPRGTTVNATASDTVPVIAGAAITLDKSADDVAGLTAGQIIEFTFEVQNTGQLTLDGVTLTDLLPGLSEIVFGAWPSGTPGTLAPGDTVIATATYRVTQADVDRGYIDNSSTATGHPARGESVQSTDTVVLTTATPAPAIALDKTTAASGFRLGDTIGYEFVVENTGNVTLSSVELSDQLSGLSAISFGAWPTAERGVLPPASRVRATAQYTVTQADVDRGELRNTATASATSPQGAAVSDDDTARTTAAAAAPAIAVTKAGALAAGSTGQARDVVEYRFTATNTGDVTLTDVTFADSLPGLSPITVTWPGGTGVLAPGQQATATATYVLTQSDVDAGAVANTVVASAQPPLGAPRVEGTAGATVPIAPGAALTAVKTGAITNGGIGQVGDVIQYEIIATNTGNVTITNGGLVDPMEDLYEVEIAWADPTQPGRLEVGASVVGRGKYRITQEDVDKGFIENVGTVGGDTPNKERVTADTNRVVISTVQPAPGIAVTKTGAATGDGGVGDDIRYTFEIRNTGNVTLSDVALEDALPGVQLSAITWPTAAAGVIAPGRTATATGTYEITQGDVDLGRVLNTATATGTPARATEPISATSPQSVVETAEARPALTVTDRGALAPGATGRAGDVVTWSYSLTNSGNVTLSGVTLADALPGVSGPQYEWNTPTGVLAPNESVTATATYTLTQADVDAGSVTSLVTGIGTPVVGAPVSTAQAATVAIAPDPRLVVTKSGAPSGGEAGSVITYSFTVANDGNVTLSGVELTDDLPGLGPIDISWPAVPGVLAPGQTATGTARYAVTQADVDAGQVVNRASATATPPGAAPFTARSNEVTIATVEAAPALVTSKSAVVSGTGEVGDTISYTITAQNTGNVTLTDVRITDELAGLSRLRSTWPGTVGVLAPSQTVTATATYTITQADVNRGEVVNTASSAGITPTGGTVDDETAPHVVATAAAAPAMDVVKTGALEAGATGEVGDVVDFAVRVENTGNVTLTAIALDDQLPGISDLDVAWPGPAAVLEPGEIATATATYALTQADIDAGKIDNEVVVGAVPARGGSVSASDAVSVVVPRSPALSAVKSGVLTGGGIGQVGDVIQYEVTVTNSGNVTVTNGSLVDPMTGLYDVSIVWPDAGAPGRVGVGQQVVGQGKYRLTQADVDRGFVQNTATVGADAPGGVRVEEDTNTVVINTVLPAGALAVTKTGALTGDGGVGDEIEYAFEVANTGNVTLSGITLTDELPGVTAPEVVWPSADGVLAPGQTATATARYTITQADLDAGNVRNVAEARGRTPGGALIEAESLPNVVATQDAAPAVRVDDRGALAPGATGRPGEVVVWSYTLTNTGNVTLSSASVSEALPGAGAPEYRWPGTPGVLLPGDSVTATVRYTLTQADVDAGAVTSVVTGTGTPAVGAAATATASATVRIDPDAGLTFAKTAALADPQRNGLGDAVTFGFRIQNSGNVTLSEIAITDQLAGIGPIEFAWPDRAGVLAPGQVATATATYRIAQEDVDRGQIENTASVRGQTPTGGTVTAASTIEPIPTVGADPSISVDKSGAYISGDGEIGSVIRYTFEIMNTGNVTLNQVRLKDELAGLSTPEIQFPAATGILAPGARAVGTATYTLTQADIDAGSVTNLAGASGASPNGDVVSGVSERVTIDTEPPTAPASAVETTQSARLASGAVGVLGDTVEYSFRIRNIGNTTLYDVTLQNTLTDLQGFTYAWPDPANPGRLLPGQSVSIQAFRLVTQADVDAGEIRNIAVGSGERPRGGEVADASPATVVRLPSGTGGLAVTKSGTLLGDGTASSLIDYAFTVTNTGTLTLEDVELSDPLSGLGAIEYGTWPGEVGVLAPGQSVSATAQYAIRQADVDEGAVRNTATANAVLPDGDPITADSPESVVRTAAAAPHIDIEKTARLADDATGRPGDTVVYVFTIVNDGNITLRDVTVGDSQPGLSNIRITWPGAAGVLAPGSVATGTAEYRLTQADVDAGRITSTARVDAVGADVVVADEDTSVVEVAAAPALTLEKTAEVESVAQQGAAIIYTMTVSNTGNVTLRGVELTDELAGLSAPTAVWPQVPGVLGAGERAVFTARYVIGQADVDRGHVDNVATAAATALGGETLQATDAVTVPVPHHAAIDLDMSIAVADGQAGRAGDTLVFRYSATNTGTSTLRGVMITDPYPGLSDLTYEWPGAPGVLLPGQTVRAVATVKITPAMEGTVVSSRAVAIAIGDGTDQVVDAANASVELPDPPGLLPDPGTLLPTTGGEVGPWWGIAGLLLLSGLLLLAASRRRENQS